MIDIKELLLLSFVSHLGRSQGFFLLTDAGKTLVLKMDTV